LLLINKLKTIKTLLFYQDCLSEGKKQKVKGKKLEPEDKILPFTFCLLPFFNLPFAFFAFTFLLTRVQFAI